MSTRVPAIEVHYPSGKVVRFSSAKEAWMNDHMNLEMNQYQNKIKKLKETPPHIGREVIKISHEALAALMASDQRVQEEQKVTNTVLAHMQTFKATLVSCNGHKVSKPEQVYEHYTNNDMKIEFKCQVKEHPPYEKALKRAATQSCPICARKRASDASREVLHPKQIEELVNNHLKDFNATLLSVNDLQI